MKFSKLVLRNVFRKPLRALLTGMLISAIFFFVVLLLSILYGFDHFTESGKGTNRLAVQSAISLANLLPYSHEAKIRQVPGVVDVCKVQWIGAYYKDPRNFFANFAIDHDHMAKVFEDYKVDPKQFADFQNDRQGALAGDALAKRFHWKVGDRITLKRQIFPYDPELTIRGIYHHDVNTSSLYYHMDYHNQSVHNFNQVGTFWLIVSDASKMAQVSQQIDAMFKNSEYPTETFTEKEFQKSFISMMGNVQQLFSAISACAIFMVVLLAAITMSMSARERVTEIAVLKAIGFSKRLLLTLMLIEFVTLTLAGGIGGVILGKLAEHAPWSTMTAGFLQGLIVPGYGVVLALGAAALVGLLAGGLPALRAANMSVVDGLRRVV
jgi:putative ABC transport system permease protein